MDAIAILGILDKVVTVGNLAIQLGKDVAPLIPIAAAATSGNVTKEQLADLDAQVEKIHADLQAIPDDPEPAGDVDAGGDGGAAPSGGTG